MYEVHWVGNGMDKTHGKFETLEAAMQSVRDWWFESDFVPPYIRQWKKGNKIIWDYGRHDVFYEFHEVD